MAVALMVAMALPFLLPERFSLFSPWISPGLEAALLVTLIIADPGRIDRRSEWIRALSVLLVIVLVAGSGVAAVHLVSDLIRGGPDTNSASQLLRVGILVWLYLIISFSFLYWELDGGGPEARLSAPRQFPDMAFPEQLNPGVAPAGWRPQFFDYLYVGFTNATAFSPTDVMPLARWAKLLMALEASGSLVILGLVIARAVNILK
ncbi:MAG TPA: hypothetical protein VHU17_20505 [Acidimicrobiales bacterium]|jgi:hypothetical protein|nr:hypothetical protein [Acidimicrobiales bacterium]